MMNLFRSKRSSNVTPLPFVPPLVIPPQQQTHNAVPIPPLTPAAIPPASASASVSATGAAAGNGSPAPHPKSRFPRVHVSGKASDDMTENAPPTPNAHRNSLPPNANSNANHAHTLSPWSAHQQWPQSQQQTPTQQIINPAAYSGSTSPRASPALSPGPSPNKLPSVLQTSSSSPTAAAANSLTAASPPPSTHTLAQGSSPLLPAFSFLQYPKPPSIGTQYLPSSNAPKTLELPHEPYTALDEKLRYSINATMKASARGLILMGYDRQTKKQIVVKIRSKYYPAPFYNSLYYEAKKEAFVYDYLTYQCQRQGLEMCFPAFVDEFEDERYHYLILDYILTNHLTFNEKFYLVHSTASAGAPAPFEKKFQKIYSQLLSSLLFLQQNFGIYHLNISFHHVLYDEVQEKIYFLHMNSVLFHESRLQELMSSHTVLKDEKERRYWNLRSESFWRMEKLWRQHYYSSSAATPTKSRQPNFASSPTPQFGLQLSPPTIPSAASSTSGTVEDGHHSLLSVPFIKSMDYFYQPPEYLSNSLWNPKKVDAYQVGLMLFIQLVGRHPLDVIFFQQHAMANAAAAASPAAASPSSGLSSPVRLANVQPCSPNIPNLQAFMELISPYSAELQDLLIHLLCHQQDRFTIRDALYHSWLNPANRLNPAAAFELRTSVSVDKLAAAVAVSVITSARKNKSHSLSNSGLDFHPSLSPSVAGSSAVTLSPSSPTTSSFFPSFSFLSLSPLQYNFSNAALYSNIAPTLPINVFTALRTANRYFLLAKIRSSLFGSVFIAIDKHCYQLVCIKISSIRALNSKRTRRGYKVLEDVRREAAVLKLLEAYFPPSHGPFSPISSSRRSGSSADKKQSSPIGSVDDGIKYVRGKQFLQKVVEELEDDEFHYLISPYSHGGDFFTYLTTTKENSKLPEGEARKFFVDLCYGIAFMHAAGIAHTDLSLENITLFPPRYNKNNSLMHSPMPNDGAANGSGHGSARSESGESTSSVAKKLLEPLGTSEDMEMLCCIDFGTVAVHPQAPILENMKSAEYHNDVSRLRTDSPYKPASQKAADKYKVLREDLERKNIFWIQQPQQAHSQANTPTAANAASTATATSDCEDLTVRPQQRQQTGKSPDASYDQLRQSLAVRLNGINTNTTRPASISTSSVSTAANSVVSSVVSSAVASPSVANSTLPSNPSPPPLPNHPASYPSRLFPFLLSPPTIRPGKPFYRCPELVAKQHITEESCWDPFAADCFSLGVILYWMVCGLPPYYAAVTEEKNRAIQEGREYQEDQEALTDKWYELFLSGQWLSSLSASPAPSPRTIAQPDQSMKSNSSNGNYPVVDSNLVTPRKPRRVLVPATLGVSSNTNNPQHRRSNASTVSTIPESSAVTLPLPPTPRTPSLQLYSAPHQELSPLCLHLISRMLAPPMERANIYEILNHPWMRMREDQHDTPQESTIDDAAARKDGVEDEDGDVDADTEENLRPKKKLAAENSRECNTPSTSQKTSARPVDVVASHSSSAQSNSGTSITFHSAMDEEEIGADVQHNSSEDNDESQTLSTQHVEADIKQNDKQWKQQKAAPKKVVGMITSLQPASPGAKI